MVSTPGPSVIPPYAGGDKRSLLRVDGFARRLLDGARCGKVVDFDGAELPAAELLALLTGATEERVHPRGMRVRGATVVGEIDWDWQTLVAPLELVDCTVKQHVSVDHAHVAGLSFQGCTLSGFSGVELVSESHLNFDRSDVRGAVHVRGAALKGSLSASGATVRAGDDGVAFGATRLVTGASLSLNEGFTALGSVVLRSAQIGGAFYCDRGWFLTPGGEAVNADSIVIGGNLFMRHGLARGRVRLLGARISANLDCQGTVLDDPEGEDALWLSNAQIGENLLLRQGFVCRGRMRLNNVTIGGRFDLQEAHLSHPSGSAVMAMFAQVKGNVDLTSRPGYPTTVVEGLLRLEGSHVRGSVLLDGVTVANAGKVAIDAQDAHIGGNLRMGSGFNASGVMRLAGIRIGGDLNLNQACLHGNDFAFDAEGMSVGGSLRWREMRCPPAGRVDWRRATVGELDDDRSGWPAPGDLQLSGFRYGRLSDGSPRATSDRLDWLRRQPGYAPEPYRQLAEVYRSNGQLAEATVIAMAQQDDLIAHGDLARPARLWRRFLGLTIGHGYRPGRAAWLLLFLYLVTAATVAIGAQHDAFTQVGQTAPQPAVTTSHCADSYPCFSVEAYALENITPLINLHQSENWHPKSSTPLEFALRDWLYLCTVAGYAGTTLLAAGLSGLARSNNH
jgi:hypothetical protein